MSEAEALSRTLVQTNLPAWLDETFLYTLYSGTGALVSAKLARDQTTGTSQCYAYIEFSSAEVADGVLRGYNGHPVPNADTTFALMWASAAASAGADGAAGGPDHSVFVGDLAPDVSDYVLTDKFRQYFPSVRSAKVITDPVTGRSKGYGFVRFGSESERDRALGEMAGHLISNRPIRVSIATAKKNTGPTTATPAAVAAANAPHPGDFDPSNTTLFIGGLSAAATEEELQAQFGRFGDIIYVKIPPGKGCGFVQYVHRSVAEVALATMQGQVIGGAAIRISWGRSSSRANASAAAVSASPYSAYSATPSAYADPYAAYGARTADPYAAYAAASYSQAPDYSAYQQAYAPVASAAPQAAAAPQANGVPSYGAATATPAPITSTRVELRDPLAPPDVKKMNQEYVQRHQAALLGSFLRAP